MSGHKLVDVSLSREAVVEYLNGLSFSELGDLINEVSFRRREDQEFENGDIEYCDVLCLALGSFGVFEGKSDERAILEVYSKPTDKVSKVRDALTEQGFCRKCGVSLVSNASEATCPICYEVNELT